MNGHYNEDRYKYCNGEYEENFNIDVENDTIKIYNNVAEVFLAIDSKDQILKAMKKYRNVLNDS